MRGRSLPSRRRQRGIAMLVAILLVAFATILAAAIGFKSAMAARRGVATLALDQSVLVAEAAEALAAYALREDAKAGKTLDYPGEAWGQPVGPLEVLPGITLEAYVQDATGKFNLNSLVGADGTVDQNALHDLEHLMMNVGVEPKWASLIADWIDPDSTPLPDGAEDSAYATQNPPYRAPNTFITSPSELLALPGFGRDRYLRLGPFVTALPRDATINVCTAPGEVLDALIGEGHKEFSSDPQRLAKSRESACFPTRDEFMASLGGDPQAQQRLGDRVKQTSSYFRLTSVVTIGTADFNLYSLLQRDATGQVHVLMRSFTPD
ncbi:MAG TPA: type II secretion system minor pseudopilin GspK [Steroidobacteraceae bacterium]|nr:type II secretion system minor pseudopilin GspK [Steroidobacteraceae bacterium]